jgi:hypothetical protein
MSCHAINDVMFIFFSLLGCTLSCKCIEHIFIFFFIYYVLIDIEKYWEIIVRGMQCKRKNIYFFSLIIYSIYWCIVKYWKILKKIWREYWCQILQKYHRYFVEHIFSIFSYPIFQKGTNLVKIKSRFFFWTT